MGRFLIAVMIAYSTYVTIKLGQPVQPAKQCVPLYNETGLECCK